MKIKLLENGIMPTKAHESDAGYDLYSTEDVMLYARGSVIIDTEVCMQIPHGYAGLLVSKSGLNVKYGITSTGLIDAGYTGTIKVKLYNNSNDDYWICKGDKISQIMILPIFKEDLEIVESLEDTDRGTNGFGSSGR